MRFNNFNFFGAKMKNRIFRFFLLMLTSVCFAENVKGSVKYISPNSDGIKDELEIPLKITDKYNFRHAFQKNQHYRFLR